MSVLESILSALANLPANTTKDLKQIKTLDNEIKG